MKTVQLPLEEFDELRKKAKAFDKIKNVHSHIITKFTPGYKKIDGTYDGDKEYVNMEVKEMSDLIVSIKRLTDIS